MKAHLYTWGGGHVTAEGERIPVKVCCCLFSSSGPAI